MAFLWNKSVFSCLKKVNNGYPASRRVSKRVES